MKIPVIMPKFEMTQETGTIVSWLFQEGDQVKKGEPLLEVETDKVTMEVEAPASGILLEIKSKEGERVPVTELIAYIDPGGEPPQILSEHGQSRISIRTNQKDDPQHQATPLARRVAAESGIDINKIPLPETGDRIRLRDVEHYKSVISSSEMEDKIRATPAARRAARESGVDLARIAGSGPLGRIQEIDVHALGHSEVDEPRIREILPFTGIRRTTAERMQISHQTAPHISLTAEVDMTEAEKFREFLNARRDRLQELPISLTVVLVKLCAWALQKHPRINAALKKEKIYIYESSNIGVAIALEDGLIVPVIHQAETLSLAEIAAKLSDLNSRAQKNKLSLRDVHDGTFTISNLGMFGIDDFIAIINPPESAILAVGRVIRRPVVMQVEAREEVVIRSIMRLTLSADHRVVDGAEGARFLTDIKDALENPYILFH